MKLVTDAVIKLEGESLSQAEGALSVSLSKERVLLSVIKAQGHQLINKEDDLVMSFKQNLMILDDLLSRQVFISKELLALTKTLINK